MSEQQGLRYNTGKRKWSFVPFFTFDPMIRVLEFGAAKYSPWNWTKGLSWTETIESLLRHTYSFLQGEDCDRESNLHHIGHIMCNVMFLSYMIITGKGKDDRHKFTEETTEGYWDCNCDEDFIHSKKETSCNKCGAKSNDQPDSRINEVVIMNINKIHNV